MFTSKNLIKFSFSCVAILLHCKLHMSYKTFQTAAKSWLSRLVGCSVIITISCKDLYHDHSFPDKINPKCHV